MNSMSGDETEKEGSSGEVVAVELVEQKSLLGKHSSKVVGPKPLVTQPADHEEDKSGKEKGPRKTPHVQAMELEEAKFRREMAIRRFDSHWWREQRNFTVSLLFTAVSGSVRAYVAYSGKYEGQDAATARAVLLPVLANVGGIIIGRLSKSVEVPDSQSPA